jgi:fructooligosaccharide transport system substrate-binding protein
MSTELTRRQVLASGGLMGLIALAGPPLLASCSSGSSASTSSKATSLTGLWVPYDNLINGSKAAMKQWIASNVPVNISTVPWADWDRTIRAFPQQSTVPAVAIVDGPQLRGYAANGILKPLSDYFPQSDIDDFMPGTVPPAQWKGKFYGPATNESSQAVVYNKDILDKHGVTPPSTLEKAWTWPEFRDVMLQIQKKERAARGNDQFWGMFLGQGNFIGGGTYTGLDIIRSAGAKGSKTFQAISDDGLSVAGYADTSEAYGAYQFLQDLYQSDQLTPQSKSPDFFFNNQIAFWLTNPDVAFSSIAEKAPKMNWGVTPHPYFVAPIVQTDSYHLGVPANSPHGDQAAELIKSMASKENAVILAETQKAIPMRKSAIPHLDYLAEANYKVFTDTVSQWGTPRPLTPGFSEYDTVYAQLLSNIATGGDIKSLVPTAVEQIDTQLARYKGLA